MQKISWKKIAGGVGGALVLIGAVGMFVQKEETNTKERLTVVATFFPYANIAEKIGGESVIVKQITPDGAEVHDYEPSPQDIAQLLSADVVITNGGGIDSWSENLESDIKNAGGILVKMSSVAPLLSVESEEEHGHGEEHTDEHEEEYEDAHVHEGGEDPHAWLDLVRMQEMVTAIERALTEKDPARGEMYAKNAGEIKAELARLDVQFSESLASCKTKNVLVAHDAFRYWEERYTIEVHAIAGISPEAEPSVKNMARLIEEAEELQVSTVFFESPASSALAKTIAEEIGAQVDVLSTLEGRTEGEQNAGEGYLDIMEKNLAALTKGLSCTR